MTDVSCLHRKEHSWRRNTGTWPHRFPLSASTLLDVNSTNTYQASGTIAAGRRSAPHTCVARLPGSDSDPQIRLFGSLPVLRQGDIYGFSATPDDTRQDAVCREWQVLFKHCNAVLDHPGSSLRAKELTLFNVLLPHRYDELTLCSEIIARNQWRLSVKRKPVEVEPVGPVDLLHAFDLCCREIGSCAKCAELANIVRVMYDGRIFLRILQDQVLHKKFDVADSALALLEIELVVRTPVQLPAHLRPH